MRKYLYCEPLFDELKCSFRFSWLLQETLKRNGILLKRFSYRGCGEAEEDFCDIEMDNILDDIKKNSDDVEGIIGLRFGAMAAIKAKLQQIEKFILLNPIIDGSKYIEELSRSQHIKNLMTNKYKLDDNCQYLNIEGYQVSKRFAGQIDNINIAKVLLNMDVKIAIISNQKDLKQKNNFCNCSDIKFIQRDFVSMWQRVGDADYGELIEEITRQCNE